MFTTHPAASRATGRAGLLIAAALFALTACSNDDATSPVPVASQSTITGNQQKGTVGSPLANPIVITVLDAKGAPMAGQTVRWEVVKGGGWLSTYQSITDSNGQSALTWVLGFTAGEGQITASVSGLPTQIVNATQEAGPAAMLLIVGGDNQEGAMGESLGSPLQVKAVDAYGNAIAGLSITWTTTAGSLSLDSNVTDSNGLAQAALTFEMIAGPVWVTASVEGLEPVTFSAMAN